MTREELIEAIILEGKRLDRFYKWSNDVDSRHPGMLDAAKGVMLAGTGVAALHYGLTQPKMSSLERAAFVGAGGLSGVGTIASLAIARQKHLKAKRDRIRAQKK